MKFNTYQINLVVNGSITILVGVVAPYRIVAREVAMARFADQYRGASLTTKIASDAPLNPADLSADERELLSEYGRCMVRELRHYRQGEPHLARLARWEGLLCLANIVPPVERA